MKISKKRFCQIVNDKVIHISFIFKDQDINQWSLSHLSIKAMFDTVGFKNTMSQRQFAVKTIKKMGYSPFLTFE